MGYRNNKLTAAAAAGLAAVLVLSYIGAVAAAAVADAPAKNQEVSGEIDKFCSATGFKETCLKSLAGAKSTKPKDLIKTAFDSTVAEIQAAIKNTGTYKKLASDKWTRGALDVCERVLDVSIDDVRKSFTNVDSFEVGKVNHALDDVKIWLSSAITNKETCIDAFAKTRNKLGEQVKNTLKTSGELLNNALAMVIEFQKLFQSIDLGKITNTIKQRQDEIPDFVSSHTRKLLEAPTMNLPPNVVVAQDGSGQYKTISEAVSTAPLDTNVSYVIMVKAGVYPEYVVIPKKMNHVILVGEGPLKTRITGNKNFRDGVLTYDSATLKVDGLSFIAKDIAVENTAGPDGHQAVALRASGDLGVYYNMHIEGFQDTLYPQSNRQFFRDCTISGTIDFIFGNAIAVFQKCTMVVRKPGPNQACMVTAQGRQEKNVTGVTVVQGCTITAEQELVDAKPPIEAYLGRPWKVMSRTIVMQSKIEAFISPLGWAPWNGDLGLKTLYYVEYNNTGPGANIPARPPGRVTWEGLKNFTNVDEALTFTAARLFQHDEWVTITGVPYDPAFMAVAV